MMIQGRLFTVLVFTIYVMSGNGELVIYQTADNQARAVTACANANGILAVISDIDRYYEVTQQITETAYWIGLKYQADVWKWQDGSSLGFSRWGASEPDTTGSKDCVIMNTSTAQWYTAICGDSYPYLCNASQPDPAVATNGHDQISSEMNDTSTAQQTTTQQRSTLQRTTTQQTSTLQSTELTEMTMASTFTTQEITSEVEISSQLISSKPSMDDVFGTFDQVNGFHSASSDITPSDLRISAICLGVFAVTMVIIMLIIVIVLDLDKLRSHFKYLKKNLTDFYNSLCI